MYFSLYALLMRLGIQCEMHACTIEINANATLEKIDDFLRVLWLDCCGHLSAFTINKTRYDSYCEDAEPDENTMNSSYSYFRHPSFLYFNNYTIGYATETHEKLSCEFIVHSKQ